MSETVNHVKISWFFIDIVCFVAFDVGFLCFSVFIPLLSLVL